MTPDLTHISVMRVVSLYLLALLIIAAGVLHFVRPGAYARIVPPFLPCPTALVYVSGGAEIVGGLGLLIPSLRPWAGVGLVVLLVAVFPANIYMAVAPKRAGFGVAPVWLWLRLPLQLLLIAWVLWAARTSRLWAG